ncbi:MAG: CorA family divalent cation transporter [Candidatus Pacebacteria bacterium]|nr:CorA family divalent cation transporter [Candidatus Paceibacterota bacterium]MDP6659574.1 CorA family divalent cation transporter [Candidatus Paceibacterota bacterium]
MVAKYKHKNITWVDVESPTQEEVRNLMEEYSIDPLVADELLLPTLKPRVEEHGNLIYLILHFPAFRHSHQASISQEVDFLIGKNFIITVRYDTVDPLHKFSKVFEVNSVLDKGDIGEHAGFLFFYMIRKLYKSLEHEIEYINDALELIETEIFDEGKSKEMVRALSSIGRDILNLKQALWPHRDVLDSFDDASARFFGDEYHNHAKSIFGEYYRIQNSIRAHSNTLNELRQTNDSLLSTRQNEIIKTLTIMAFITFPLTLISSVFGMNTQYLPIVGRENDFWLITGAMLALTFAFFIFFKRKHWL